jgi:CRP/FNR family transcriptional regulator, cyclic AMP receptor protein
MMSLMDLVAVLADSSLFSGMPRQDLEALAPAATSRTFRKGSYIFREGDVGNALYVINRGQVKISRMGRGGEEAVYAILVAGDSFGEIALLSGDAARTADAQAMELTECVSVAKDPLLAFLNQYPALSRHLMRALARYVQQVDESLAEIAFPISPDELPESSWTWVNPTDARQRTASVSICGYRSGRWPRWSRPVVKT